MELVRENVATGYERIRKHILAQIAKAGSSSMRVASSREMAAEFGVAQTTVARVFKDLAAMGYLTMKPGVGAFTNNERNAMPRDSKVVGLLSGDGMEAFSSAFFWHAAPVLTQALAWRSRRFHIQQYFLSGGDPEKELSRLGFDGLVCIDPGPNLVPAILKLSKAGLPVLTVKAVPGLNSLRFDFDADNYAVGKRMLGKGAKRILLVASSEPDYSEEEALRGLKRSFAEAGRSFDETLVVENSKKSQADFAKTLLRLRPDAIIFNANIVFYWDAIQECRDALGPLQLYSGVWSVSEEMGFQGLLGTLDASSIKRAVELFAKQLDDPKARAPFVETLKLKIIDSEEY